jgi:hypothetical protein
MKGRRGDVFYLFICLVQKRGAKGRWEILIQYVFGSQREGRDFIIKLHFYPYNLLLEDKWDCKSFVLVTLQLLTQIKQFVVISNFLILRYMIQ